ncbi:MAG TPA: MarR family winged helix-turn-helix transcriptional regulator [Burkholderiales bacterium]
MTQQADRELPMEVLKKFRLLYGSVRAQFRDIESSCGVSGSQLWILQEVQRTPHIGISDLAGRLHIHQSTCSQLVEKLVARHLLEKQRSQADQRRVGLILSNEAAELLARAPGPAEGLLPDALGALPDGALRTLDEALKQVIAQLRERDERYAERPLADL